jgi:glutamate--cysteine ligase
MRAASLEASLNWLASIDNHGLLEPGLRGFEKECLRVGADGRLALTPHSPAFGSPLTHPYLTTDYSEALLEFVTPPCEQIDAALRWLDELHAFVQQRAGEELLWPASMPCIIATDEAVPIAQYGPSNEGRLRTIYRSGLGYRYGRAMQAIAGTHFNYSLPAGFWLAFSDFRRAGVDVQTFRSNCLMGLIRNYRRVGWLVTYLFGASPAFCKSFRPNGHPRLESLNSDTWYAPYSTSLRMSDMGYRNSTQSRLSISVNSLDEYLVELARALTTPEPRYEAIGVRVDGDYRQLNANLLQLENEYYSSIRPKPASKSPRLIAALASTGVEYVEVRTLDLNPFAPVGVTGEQARLIELLLLYCLLADSGPIAEAEQAEIDQRELLVAWEGRRPGLVLSRDGEDVALKTWALELIDGLAALAGLLDGDQARYADAVGEAREAVLDPRRTLSAQVLEGLDSGAESFFEWAFARATRNRAHFLAYEFRSGRLEALETLARRSLDDARAEVAADQAPFDEFLARYLAAGLEPKSRKKLGNM